MNRRSFLSGILAIGAAPTNATFSESEIAFIEMTRKYAGVYAVACTMMSASEARAFVQASIEDELCEEKWGCYVR